MADLASGRRRLPAWPPRGGLSTALGAVLFGVALFVVAYALASLIGPARPGVGSLATAVVPAPPVAIPTPLDVAALHATAEAPLNRAPNQRQAVPPAATRPPAAAPTRPSGPTPPAAGAPTPAAVGPVTPPTRTPSSTATPTTTRGPQFPSVTPRATHTETVTPTSTPTETPTPTPTPTPLPVPCQLTVPVPRLAFGNGYYLTVEHEYPGEMTVRWNLTGGTILVYRGKPSDLGPDRLGVADVIPPDEPLLRAASGPITRSLGQPEPDQYTFYFFNGSPLGLGPLDAQVGYWTYGHCP
ncbi:MAG TPA: hypothetical protein VGM69_25890 [Chloroflexota bacterium]|jgi:hypothetical protein